MKNYMLFATLVGAMTIQTGAGGQSAIEIQRGTTVDRLGTAWTDRIPDPTMFREVHLKVPMEDGKTLNGELLIAHDTISHQFWWHLQNAGDQRPRLDSAEWFATHASAYASDDRMVVFWEIDPGAVLAVERKGLTALDLDEAQQKAIDEIGKRASEIGKGSEGLGLGGTVVRMTAAQIPPGLWHAPDQAYIVSGRTRVVEASREGRNWKLILRDQWDQELILDDSYRFVSSRRVNLTAAGRPQ